MNKSGVVHNTNLNNDESTGKAAIASIKDLLDRDGAGSRLKADREPFYAHKVIINGIRPTLKNGLKKPITFVEQVDKKGRTVEHYMAQCEETGKRRMLSRFKL